MEDIVNAAREAEKAARETEKTAKAELREAQKNHKQAVAYNAAMADDAPEKDDARSGEEGWAAEVGRRQAALDEATAALNTAKEATAAARAEAKAAKETAKAPRDERNGQVAPRPNTISAKLWEIFDGARERLQRVPAISEVLDEAKAAGVVEGSVKAGYAQWRKYHGVTGRTRSQAQMDADRAKAEAAAAKAAAPAPAPEQPAPAPEAEPAGEPAEA